MKPESLIATVANLPAPSPSVERLLELLARPDADNDDLIKLVRQDGVMSANLLGLCNAAAYGLSAPINSIAQAVLRLGHCEIQRLVMSVSFRGALCPALGGYAIAASELWGHSLLAAYVAVAVAASSSRVNIDPSIAYTAGLVHDLGKIVIAHALDDPTQAAMRELIARKESSLVEAEKCILGTDHAEVGECLLRKWGLPELVLESVANHHKPVLQPQPQLSAIVHVADAIAHEVGASPGWASYAMRVDENAVAALGLGRADIERLTISGYDALHQVEEIVASI